MAVAVLIRDEVLGSKDVTSFELEFPTEQLTVRELIRERVYQEVQDHNQRRIVRKMLVEPSREEVDFNGENTPRVRQTDYRQAFDRACEAYERRGVLVLVGDRQTKSLEETVTLTRGVEVTFVRLVMLVGG